MLIVGENEAAANSVSVRRQGEGDKGVMSVEEFIKLINDEVETQTKSLYSF
jgi:threonyl-tRNA synthetase